MRRLALLLCLVLSGCCTFSERGFRGPPSDHFDGRRFHNLSINPGFEERSPLDLVWWLITRDPGPWPYENNPPGPKPPASVGRGQMRATFVNHATVLVQMDGINVLTDPVWSERIGPLSGIGPKRHRAPGIRFEDLPRIHAVVLSHNHYDHFDLPTLKRLWEAHQPWFYVGLGNRELLLRNGIPKVRELDWWQSVPLLPHPIRIHSVPVQHFSMRGLCDRNCTLWTGWVIEGPAGKAFFGGDTGYGPHFSQVGEKLGPIRLAILPIGAYRPEWFMEPVHIGPKQALIAQKDLRATTALGMHFGTFQQADDGMDEPVEDLNRLLKRRKIPPERFWALSHGEGRDVPPVASASQLANTATTAEDRE